jgi:hemolysin activation/secretion protein
LQKHFVFQPVVGLFSLWVSGMLSWGCLAAAQTVEPISAEVFPGAILQDLQKKNLPSELQPDTQRQSPATAPVEGEPQQPVDVRENAPLTEDPFVLTEIQLQGMTLLDNKKVQSMISAYENRKITLADIHQLTREINALYSEEGYVTSQVYIPPQQVQNGVLRLQALEGRVGKINVKAGRYFKAGAVMNGMVLKSDQPFDADVLRRNLRQLNENPDRRVSAALKPGEKSGETDIELEVVDKQPFHLSLTQDNLGRRLIGDNRLGLQATHNNLLGFGDTLISSLSFTRRSFGIVDQYTVPIGSHGTRLGFNHAYSQLRLGEGFTALNVKGTASSYSPFLTQELLNRKTYKLYVDMAFDFKQLDTNLLGQDFTRDQLRILRPAITLEAFDKWGRTFTRHEVELGLDIFGATLGNTISASREGAGSQFFNYTGTLIRTQKLPFSTYGIFRAIGQISPDRLVSSQQFQAGGAYTVRGYREGLMIGDSGLVVSSELRMPLFFVPKTWGLPRTTYKFRDQIQLVSFADYGSVFTNKPAPGVGRQEQILGVGVGIRVQLTRFLTGRLDLAYPLLNQPGNSGARLHFGLQSSPF